MLRSCILGDQLDCGNGTGANDLRAMRTADPDTPDLSIQIVPLVRALCVDNYQAVAQSLLRRSGGPLG
jgi:hypothetical protein